MRVTTSFYDGLQRKQIGAAPGIGGNGGMSANAAPNMGAPGDSSTSQQIEDYLTAFSAREARAWRDRNIWCQIAIGRRIEDLRDQEWRVGPINPKLEYDAEIAGQFEQTLAHPNVELENNTFGGLLSAAIDDVYTLGRAVVQMLLNDNLTPRAYRALDPARFFQNEKWKANPETGLAEDTPDSPDDAKRFYFQETYSRRIYLSSREVVLMVPRLSTHTRGLSPMSALRSILQAELDTRRNMHGTQKYRTPPGVFIMPGAAPGSPEKMRLMYDLKMAGRFGIGFMNLPASSKFIDFGQINLLAAGTFQFYEILVRATAASFAMTPFSLGWTDQDNRANTDNQLILNDRGQVALLKFVRQIINGPVADAYRAAYGSRMDNIGFNWLALADEDELDDAQTLRAKAGRIGFISPQEVRERGGLTPFDMKQIDEVYHPFFTEFYVPSAFPGGVELPVTYAAMSFGIAPGMNNELLSAMLAGARNQHFAPPPPEEIPGAENAGDTTLPVAWEQRAARLRP